MTGLSQALAAAAVLWCMAIGARIWTTPIRSEGVTIYMSASPAGTQQIVMPAERVQSFSDISALGPVPLIIPIAIAAAGLLAALNQRPTWLGVATGVLLLFCLLAGFTIGPGYLPAAIGLLLSTAASLSNPSRQRFG